MRRGTGRIGLYLMRKGFDTQSIIGHQGNQSANNRWQAWQTICLRSDFGYSAMGHDCTSLRRNARTI